MDILIIEDDPQRTQAFLDNLHGTSTIVLHSIQRAVSRLTKEKLLFPRIIFLDTFLEKSPDPQGGGNGALLAGWASEHRHYFLDRNTYFILHDTKKRENERIGGILGRARIPYQVAPEAWRHPAYLRKLAEQIRPAF